MKRIITLVAIAALAVSTATAQKISSKSFEAKIEKSNADIANPKKSGKAATWITRGKICSDAITAPTKNLFTGGLTVDMLPINLGVAPTDVKDNIYVFEWVDVYTKDGKVIGWTIKKPVLDNAYEIAKEAFLKAYELDPASADKIKSAIETLVRHYEDIARVSLDIAEHQIAIDAHLKAVGLQENPAYGSVNPRHYFFAGQIAVYLGSTKDEKLLAEGEKYLEKALQLGYKDDIGNIYYFMFHCYYGQRNKDKEYVTKANNAILEGIEKYPRNELILDALIEFYTSKECPGDPAILVERIEGLLAEKPDNAELWFARAKIFNALKNYDECIKSFLKINELKPNDYNTNFYLGYFYLGKGDEALKQLTANADSYTSIESYNAAIKEVNMVYMKALPWFEKAMELKPESVDCAESLKALCFRLRDEEGMMDKYNKYNALYKKLKGIQ